MSVGIITVSILSRPEGRLQLVRGDFKGHGVCVSILSRPEGRLQQQLFAFQGDFYLFQSSAAPKDGCNEGIGIEFEQASGFNPQPPRRTAATTDVEVCELTFTVSILSRPEGRLQR